MVRRTKYKLGTKWGKLTIIEIIDGQHVRVQCDCGSESKIIHSSSLAKTRSCKCVWRKTHGGTGTPLYAVWDSMKQRCNNPRNKYYKSYGGRGIKICKAWEDFKIFREWAQNNGYKKGLTIERKNNNRGYTPSNCSWETMAVQSRNKRVPSSNTSGYVGVHWHKYHRRWVARYFQGGEIVYLGEHKTPEEANKARQDYIKGLNK